MVGPAVGAAAAVRLEQAVEFGDDGLLAGSGFEGEGEGVEGASRSKAAATSA